MKWKWILKRKFSDKNLKICFIRKMRKWNFFSSSLTSSLSFSTVFAAIFSVFFFITVNFFICLWKRSLNWDLKNSKKTSSKFFFAHCLKNSMKFKRQKTFVIKNKSWFFVNFSQTAGSMSVMISWNICCDDDSKESLFQNNWNVRKNSFLKEMLRGICHKKINS